MIGSRHIAKGQVEHEARRQIAQTLLRTGPLSVRGLARETELSKAHVRRHLQTLSRAGAVVPEAAARIGGEEVTYGLTLRGLPRWAFEGLIGKFAPVVCLAIADVLEKAERMTPAEMAEQTGLSENDVGRHLLFMEAVGWIETETSPWPDNPLRAYVKRVKNGWWVYFGLGRGDDSDRPGGG